MSLDNQRKAYREKQMEKKILDTVLAVLANNNKQKDSNNPRVSKADSREIIIVSRETAANRNYLEN